MRLSSLAAAVAASLALSIPSMAGAAAPKPAPPAAAAQPNAPKPPPPPTEAELKCQAEVTEAVEKQRKTGQFRSETNMLTDMGPAKMTVEYILPNKMRQLVALVTDPKPVETIVIDSKAWSNAGEGWEPLAPDVTKQLIEKMVLETGDATENSSRWNCLGKMTVEGKELTAYEGKEDAPKDMSPGGPTMPENEAARYMYIDPATGLPERGIFARKGKLDKPIFKTVYSYPTDLKIEAPAEVK